MKFSVRWLFEHLIGDYRLIDIHQLVETFNKKTAEIERVIPVKHALDNFSVVQVVAIDANQITVWSPEWQKNHVLAMREGVVVGQWYLVKKHYGQVMWALMSDLASDKDGLVGPVHVEDHEQEGDWKKTIAVDDSILEVDNKSITHRPDLWGHRGIAREIGAYFGLPLKPLSDFLTEIPLKRATHEVAIEDGVGTLRISVAQKAPCVSIATMRCADSVVRPSSLAMIFKLAAVDIKPISAPVDITNYVMFDLGTPMHAFDAGAIKHDVLEVRLAKNGEKLTLLDGETITLTGEDLVIADGEHPISLAGVMGGKNSGITEVTSSLVLEAGCFEAGAIRRTATHHKKRTDASARFEKGLDATAPVLAIRRFLSVAQQQGVFMRPSSALLVVGADVLPQHINLDHAALEEKLGITIAPEKVIEILQRLEFEVTSSRRGDALMYAVTVPVFRATKDVTIPEDLIEEIARFYGYDHVPRSLPIQQHLPWDMHPVMRLRAMKNFLAYGLSMQEVCNYALYDEQFLQRLAYVPENTTQVQFPVSEHWRRPVTSLIPHLIKTVEHNVGHNEQLRFFEWGRTWSVKEATLTEQRVLAGIMVHQKIAIDFYSAKQELERMFELLDMDIAWQRIDMPQYPWLEPYESAHLISRGTVIGYAGNISKPFLHRVVHGDAFIFELDGDVLIRHDAEPKKYKQPSKYPEVVRDISMFVSESLTVAEVIRVIKGIDPRIDHVSLIDFMPAMQHDVRKALTVRFVLQDDKKTLTKEEADAVVMHAVHALQGLGAVIR
ncbi:phenylalanine--tRNA ligase subunit beta [Candidatus Dependentiae bacterium]|nr:phenylalanine--tRNA ligase subunit beta [Candidatus Dependentiae bacterium]